MSLVTLTMTKGSVAGSMWSMLASAFVGPEVGSEEQPLCAKRAERTAARATMRSQPEKLAGGHSIRAPLRTGIALRPSQKFTPFATRIWLRIINWKLTIKILKRLCLRTS